MLSRIDFLFGSHHARPRAKRAGLPRHAGASLTARLTRNAAWRWNRLSRAPQTQRLSHDRHDPPRAPPLHIIMLLHKSAAPAAASPATPRTAAAMPSCLASPSVPATPLTNVPPTPLAVLCPSSSQETQSSIRNSMSSGTRMRARAEAWHRAEVLACVRAGWLPPRDRSWCADSARARRWTVAGGVFLCLQLSHSLTGRLRA